MSEYIVEVRGQMPDAVYENQREEIVRCRDCVWYEAMEYRRHCDRTGSFQIEPDGFCKWGERK